MSVKLRVLHGKLKNRRGNNLGAEVSVRRSRFVIGSADDCHMRCQSRTISPYHCELLVGAEGVQVRDLGSGGGTFVNGQKVEADQLLTAGDQLRVGRLTFELMLGGAGDRDPADSEREVEAADPSSPAERDPIADYVSEMLVDADEEDRARRMEDPRERQFTPSKSVCEDQPIEQPPVAKRPPKKPPGKLPAPPKYVADNTIEAAEETLKKIFQRPKK